LLVAARRGLPSRALLRRGRRLVGGWRASGEVVDGAVVVVSCGSLVPRPPRGCAVLAIMTRVGAPDVLSGGVGDLTSLSESETSRRLRTVVGPSKARPYSETSRSRGKQGAWSSYNPAHKPDHSKPHPDATYGLGYLLPVVDAAATHRAPSYIIDAAAIGTALRLFVPSGSGVHDQLLRPADRLLQYSHDFRCGHAFSARPLSRSTTPARCSPSPPRRSSRPWTNVSPRRLSPAGRCS
jgi:hypothetical protein